MNTLNMKVDSALKHIEHAIEAFGPNAIFLGHSGGKDSCVIYSLTKRLLPDAIVVHNVKPLLGTSGDPVAALTEQHPLTLEFLYTQVALVDTVQLLHSSRMVEFLERNCLRCQVDGARRSEAGRAGKSANFIMDGQNVNRASLPSFVVEGIFGISMCYPIFDWTDDDVFQYLIENNVPFSDEYRKNGELAAYLESYLERKNESK